MEQKVDLYRGEGSILKVDLKGFSTFSMGAEDHEMRQVPYAILGSAEKAARRNGGVPLKRDGDATTISFNLEEALKSVQEGAVAAVRSGLQMQEAIDQARQELELREDILRARIGISTGTLEFGGYYTGNRFMPDINGKPMSIATRLESSSDLGEVRVDGRTKKLAEKLFEWESLGEIELKGIGKVDVYRPKREIVSTFDIGQMREAFFGREDEIKRIHDYMVHGGDPLLIVGEMGIGKTATAGRGMGGKTLVKFSAPDRTTPFALLKNFYRTVFSNDVKGRLKALSLEDEYQWVADVLGMDTTGYGMPDDPDARRLKIIEAYHRIRRMFDAVLFDDIQWADPLSVGVIRNSPRDERNVLTGRPEFDPDFSIQKIELNPLGEKESRQILKEFLGKYYSQLDEKSVGQMIEKTQGNPFHTKYLAISLREKMELGAEFQSALDELPSEMSSLILGRIQEYGPVAFKFFRAASHLKSKEVYVKDIEEIIDERLDEETIERMRRAGLVAKPREETIEVADEKLLEVMYDATPPDEKQRIHRLLGELYEREYNKSRKKAFLANTANQYLLSDNPGKAVAYLLELGKDERELGATETSEEHLKKALEILDQEPDSWETKRRKLEVLRELGLTYGAMRLESERIRTEQAKVETAEEIEKDIRRSNYRSWTAIGYDLAEKEPDKAIELLNKAKGVAEEEGDKGCLIHIALALGRSYRVKKDYAKSEMLYREGLESAKESEDFRSILDAHNGLARVNKAKNNFDEAEREYHLAFETAVKIGNKGGMGEVKRNLGYLEHERGNLELCLRYFEESLQLAKEAGRTETQLDNLCNISYLYIQKGNTDQARPYLEEGVRLLDRHRSLRELSSARYIQEQAGKLK